MRSSTVWCLVLLNAALLAGLFSRVYKGNPAMAQNAGQLRPGDFLIVPAEINGASNGIIVVVDQTNRLLSAVSFDDSNRRVDYMEKIDLQRVFNGNAPAPKLNR